MSSGLVHNPVRRGHRGATTLIGLLTIPKKSVRYGDGHYRKTIYGIEPSTADDPEQVLLAFHALWDDYGVIPDCKPLTYDFPHADTHELLTSDLLHQSIRDALKDHLITWIFGCLELKFQCGKAVAERIVADSIDRRVAAVPSFPGLRRLPQGRGFEQAMDGRRLKGPHEGVLAGSFPPSKAMRRHKWSGRSIWNSATSSVATPLTRMRSRKLEQRLSASTVSERSSSSKGVRPDGALSNRRQHALVRCAFGGALNGSSSSITEWAHTSPCSKEAMASQHPEQRATSNFCSLSTSASTSLRRAAPTSKSRHMLSPQQRPVAHDLPLPAATGDEEDNAGASESRTVAGEVFLAKTRDRKCPI
ncbi:hypothetical protein EV122DRAFT_284775 [Schizophyllum commune]